MSRGWVLLCLSVGAFAQTGYWPGEEWRRSTPAEQNLKTDVLANLVQRIRSGAIRDLDSLLIVRNGYLVVEEYFNGWRASDAHTLQSDTKSVLALLTGIAVDSGAIPGGASARVLDFFPSYAPFRAMDSRKDSIRIQDLLTMRTGFDWSEATSPNPLTQLNNCQCDWQRFVLDWSMRESPGQRWEYNSGGVILLGGLIRAATGIALNDFARQRLFEPLGIRGQFWYVGQPDNLPHGGGGLNLRSQDMARIGYLVLRNGRWNDQRIVSRNWIATMLQHHVTSDVWTFVGRRPEYGYLWWLYSLDGGTGPASDIYTCSGSMDQWIFVIPKYDLVVAVNGHTSTTFAQPLSFLYSDILAAIDDRPLSTVNAASFQPTISSDSIATAFGANLARDIVIRDSEGIERPAESFYSDNQQVNFFVPAGVAPGLATVRSGGANVGTVMVDTVAPGLFAAVAEGNRVALYGTGLRAGRRVTSTVGVVEYAGPQCCVPGFDQVNVLLPEAPVDNLEIAVVVDGQRSNAVRVRH